MSRLITDEMVQAAFDWLVSSSDDIAHARGALTDAEYEVKKAHARQFLAAEGSIDVRKAKATCSADHDDAVAAHVRAEVRWEALRDRRNKMELLIEAWRTQASNERGIMRAGR